MTFGIPTSAVEAADSQLARARLEIERPRPAIIPLRFNPSEYTVRKTQNFAEIGIPGLNSPLLQWVRGGAEVLSFDALVDTTHKDAHVDKEYVDRIRQLLDFDPDLHAPPIVTFAWAHRRFTGVLDGLGVNYLLFNQKGEPIRAKLNISIKEHRTAKEQRPGTKRSPDQFKTWVVRINDTLPMIAYAVYKDPSTWRVLAVANGLTDPGQIVPGQRLRIPRLR